MELSHGHLCACTSKINVAQHTFPPFFLAELYFHSKHQLRKIKPINCIQHTLWLFVEFGIFPIADCHFLKDTAELKLSQNMKAAQRKFSSMLLLLFKDVTYLREGPHISCYMGKTQRCDIYVFSDSLSLSKEDNTPGFDFLLPCF